ncbi:major facilitator superfamily MFS_1 [Elusimicrobium minutum Pei191]|uniref:Major facilitator superfamily MFS_1 n=1 Tax=Elusimicrobium minutum (strain Pei191) TaxID=445932 RepID=B2KCU5_ELUMP|nr:MFS transporter [Elusimicrobium minutum]ACC98341.1 major facilitator superfamily MFS_1 [Elusimicrobium minutum Pei191]
MASWFRINKAPLARLLTMEGSTAMARYTMVLVLPWYILSTNSGPLALGGVAFAMMMPGVFGAYTGGWAIEKLGARRTILISDICQLLCTVIIFFTAAYDFIPVYFLIFIIFLSAFCYAPGKVARTTVIPVYARYGRVSQAKAFGYREAVNGTATVIAPLIGGFVIAWFGIPVAVLVSLLFFSVAVALCLQMIKRKDRRLKYKSKSSFKRGFKYVLKHKHIFLAILFTLPFFILGTSWEVVVLPTYVNLHSYNSVFFGFLESVFGMGMLIGGLLYAAYGRKVKFKYILIINYLAYIIPILMFIINVNKATVLGATFICGIPFGAYAALMTTFLTFNTPEFMRAKILSLYISLGAVFEAAGILLIAFLINGLSFNNTMKVLIVIFCLVLSASIFVDIKSKPIRKK